MRLRAAFGFIPAVALAFTAADAHATPCQELSDTYAIVHGRSFGTAPAEVQRQWRARGCSTAPSPGRVPSLCQELSNEYSIVHGVSFGAAPAEVRGAWTALSCSARPTVVNLARNKPARQSSMFAGGDPRRAVDGRTDGNWAASSVTHTDALRNSWLEVDLGAPSWIADVRVFNRTDCCTDRLNGASVELSVTPCNAPTVIATRPLPLEGAVVAARTKLTFAPAARARYVCVRQPNAQYLSVAEIEVIEGTAPPPTGLSREQPSRTTGPASCSAGDCRQPYDSSRNVAHVDRARAAVAKDGAGAADLNDGYYGGGSSWTSGSAGSWFKIDLGRPLEIEGVRLGRDRAGALDDRDPGQLAVFVATTDAIYAGGNDDDDATEYRPVFDTAGTGFNGTLSGRDTLRLSFPRTVARFIKVRAGNAGAAIDELEVVRSPSLSIEWAAPDMRANVAFTGPGIARAAVAKDGQGAASINDGRYGGAWVSGGADSWIKLDLGRIVTVDRVRLGRDRTGALDDRDPGRFRIALAHADAVYAAGNDAADAAEYTQVFDSDDARFSGSIAGRQTLEVALESLPARFVKITFANAGAAIDEVEVESDASSDIACGAPYHLGTSAGAIERNASGTGVTTGTTLGPLAVWNLECAADKYRLVSTAGDYLAPGSPLATSATAQDWNFDLVASSPRTHDPALILRPATGDGLTEHYTLASALHRPPVPDWECVPGLDIPVRLREGEIECAAGDRGCLTASCDASSASAWSPAAGSPRPRARRCAAADYATPGHWCAIACAHSDGCTAMGVEDLSRNRPASQSSCSAASIGTDPARGVDGLVSGSFGFQTAEQIGAWWRVDLGNVAALAELRIVNRGDCCGERLASLVVEVSSGELPETMRTVYIHDRRTPTRTGGTLTIPMRGVRARYVRLRLADRAPLHLDEVTIGGRPEGRRLASTTLAQPDRRDPPLAAIPFQASGRVSADGAILSMDGQHCLEASRDASSNLRLTLERCSGRQGQIWRFVGRRIETDLSANGANFCLERAASEGAPTAEVAIARCAGNSRGQTWRTRGEALIENLAGGCLSSRRGPGQRLQLLSCATTNPQQRWSFDASERRIALGPLGQYARKLAESCAGSECSVREEAMSPQSAPRMWFVQRRGLADPFGVSLELESKPGNYLGLAGDRVVVGPVTDRAQATFFLSAGLSDPLERSLESLARPGHWLRLREGRVVLEPAAADPFPAQATFNVANFFAPDYTPVTPHFHEPLRSLDNGHCLSVDAPVGQGSVPRIKSCPVATDRDLWGTSSGGDYVHKESGLCLTAPRGQCEGLSLRACTNDPRQKWTVDVSDHHRAVRRGDQCLVNYGGHLSLASCPRDVNLWTAMDLMNELALETWQCVPGYTMPLRKYRGEIECATRDGRNCLSVCPVREDVVGWAALDHSQVRPLTCGAQYTDPTHWCATAARRWHGTDYMVIMSDPQYPWVDEHKPSTDAEIARVSLRLNEDQMASVKALVKQLPPGSFRGVIINGDLTAYGEGSELEVYRRIYEQSGLMIYPGLGNHDYQNNVNPGNSDFGGDSGCVRNTCARRMLAYVRDEIATKVKWSRFDDFDVWKSYEFPTNRKTYRGSLAYSWDIGDLHFIQLHNYPAYTRRFNGWNFSDARKDVYEITSSMDWLRRDLALARNAGRKIIVNMHDASDNFLSQNPREFDTFKRMLDEYSVSAVFNGHMHQICETDGWKPYDAAWRPSTPLLFSGASSYSNYLLVGFFRDRMTVERISSVDGGTRRTPIGTFTLLSPRPNPPLPVPPEPEDD